LAEVSSLRARLGVSTALVIAAVVGLSTYLQARIVAKAVEAEELDAAAAIALGVSADLGEHIQAPTTAELVDLLADYRKAVPAVRSITVTAVAPPLIVAGTDAAVPNAALGLGERAVAQGEPVSFADGPMGLHLVAVPLERQRQRYGAVVVRWEWTPCGACRTRAGRPPSSSRRSRSCCW
jgi:hypothetical protein